MIPRNVMILPIAAGSASSDDPTGDEFVELLPDVARGLTMDIARLMESWPGIEATASWMFLRPDGAEEMSWYEQDEMTSPDLARRMAESDGDATFVLAGKLTLEGALHWEAMLLDVETGEVVLERDVEAPVEDIVPAIEEMLFDLAACLRVGHGDDRCTLPTRSGPAYLNFCVGLSCLKCLELDIEPRPEMAYDRLLAALEADSQFALIPGVLATLTEEYLSRPGLPRHIARRALDQVIGSGHETPLLLRQRGLVECELDEPERAMTWFRRALAAGDSADTCTYYLAKCAESLRDWEEMAGWTARLKQAAPDDAANHMLHGVAAIHNKRYDDAIESWRRALQLDPDLSIARANIALAMLQQGDPQAALAEIESELAAGAGDWDFVHVAGAILAEAGEKERAVALMNGFIAENNLDADQLLEAGHLALHLDRDDDARELFEEILVLAPDSEPADVAARILCDLAEPGFEKRFQAVADAVLARRSIGELTQLALWTRRFPFCWHLWYVHGAALWQNGQLPRARAALEEADRRRPRHPRILDKLATLLLEMDERAAALECIERALALAPNESHLNSNCALILAYVGRFDEADEHLYRATMLEPNDRQATLIRPIVRRLRERPDLPLPRRGMLPTEPAPVSGVLVGHAPADVRALIEPEAFPALTAAAEAHPPRAAAAASSTSAAGWFVAFKAWLQRVGDMLRRWRPE